jgi:hypothetical protein
LDEGLIFANQPPLLEAQMRELTIEEVKEIIEIGTGHRGWIANSFAQIEYLLGDLIVRARQFPNYNLHTQTVSHSAPQRIAKVRLILALEGPLVQFANRLGPLLDAFEQNQAIRNLLAHGYCEFHYTPTGDAGFYFRKFDRAKAEETGDDAALLEKTFRLIDLEYHRAQLVELSVRVMEVIADVHVTLGWANHKPGIVPD